MKDTTQDFIKYVAEQEAIEHNKLMELKRLAYQTNNPILIKWVEDNYNPYHCGGHYVEQMILKDLGGTQEDLNQAKSLLDMVGWERY